MCVVPIEAGRGQAERFLVRIQLLAHRRGPVVGGAPVVVRRHLEDSSRLLGRRAFDGSHEVAADSQVCHPALFAQFADQCCAPVLTEAYSATRELVAAISRPKQEKGRCALHHRTHRDPVDDRACGSRAASCGLVRKRGVDGCRWQSWPLSTGRSCRLRRTGVMRRCGCRPLPGGGVGVRSYVSAQDLRACRPRLTSVGGI